METSEPSGSAILLRPATAEDAAAILTITRAAFAAYEGRLDPPTSALKETLEELVSSLFQPDHGAALALVGNQPVGALRWSISPQRDHLYVGRVAVLPAYRRRGIASALMRWSEDHARALGLPAIEIGVRLQLPENLRFYEHLGYQITAYERHEGYDQPTFAAMRKDVHPAT
jgi:ribosomal protein S18 acetylase RimI-like enzyme